MLPGDLILESPGDRWGSIVAAVSGGRYNHVRLVVDEDGRSVSAEDDGVVREPDLWEGDLHVVAPLSSSQRAQIPAIADELVGLPYDRLGMVLCGLARLGVRTPWISRELARPSRLICSQLVDLAWRRAGFHAFDDGRQPQAVTPGDLADVAFRRGWPVYTL